MARYNDLNHLKALLPLGSVVLFESTDDSVHLGGLCWMLIRGKKPAIQENSLAIWLGWDGEIKRWSHRLPLDLIQGVES